MLGYNVFAADTDAEARFLASSMQHSFVSLRTGVPQKLQPPMEGYYDGLPLATQTMLDKVLRASAIGGQDAVERGLRAFIEKTGADEIIITCQMFDHEARKRSRSEEHTSELQSLMRISYAVFCLKQKK